MDRVYYAVRFRLDHKDHWLTWHSDSSTEGNEPDGVVIDPHGLVLVFRSQQNCMAYAETLEIVPMDEHYSAFFNLDIYKNG